MFSKIELKMVLVVFLLEHCENWADGFNHFNAIKIYVVKILPYFFTNALVISHCMVSARKFQMTEFAFYACSLKLVAWKCLLWR